MAEDEKKAPTSLKRGLPAEQNNGLFGAEDRIIALGVDGRFTAVVEFEVADVVHSEADGTERPVIEFVHIEPIWDDVDRNTVAAVREDALKVRTGETQLDFGDLDAKDSTASPAPESERPDPQWDDDEKLATDKAGA